MQAIVTRLLAPPPVPGDWNAPPWQAIPAERLGNHMGERPAHFPRTEVKIAYDPTAIHLLFRVADRHVRAVAAAHQESVCGDSCVEFFFTPGSDLSRGYFNVEMNCGGTLLFHYHREGREGGVAIPMGDCQRLARAHSLPRMVDPEIREAVTWTVQYALPIALLRRYCPVTTPAPQVQWRANFYKCADGTSHPHWLSWAPVDSPRPDFHRPRSFGVLEFS